LRGGGIAEADVANQSLALQIGQHSHLLGDGGLNPQR
jgi:hypothetical protein